MKKALLLLAIMFISSVAYAGQVTQSGLKVSKVMTGYQGGQIYFLVDKKPVNPKGCRSPDEGYNALVVDPQKSDVSQVLSVLLTAKVSRSNIEIQVYDDYCFDDYAVLKRVAIY